MIPEYDKYAPFIWWSYGITAVVLLGVVWWSVARAAKIRRELESLDGARRRAKVEAP